MRTVIEQVVLERRKKNNRKEDFIHQNTEREKMVKKIGYRLESMEIIQF